MKRIEDTTPVVVGTGCVTPLGVGTPATRAALAAGRAVAPPAGTVAPPYLRAEFPPEIEAQSKFLNASGQMAATAVGEACAAARLSDSGIPDARKALYLAQLDLEHVDTHHFRTSFLEATESFTKPVEAQALNVATLRKMTPFYLLETLTNNAFSFLTAWQGMRGPNTSVSGWQAQGLLALSLAAREVRRGDADVALAVGAGCVAGAAARFEEEHVGALPPGAVASEGAGAVVLEALGKARARGVTPLAAVVGLGAAFDPAGKRARRGSPSALASAAGQALSEAGVGIGDLAAVAAADPETAATALSVIPAAKDARVLPWHRAVGEAGPASDLIDVALVAHGLADGTIHGKTVLVLAVGQEGSAVALVLARV